MLFENEMKQKCHSTDSKTYSQAVPGTEIWPTEASLFPVTYPELPNFYKAYGRESLLRFIFLKNILNTDICCMI